MVALSKNERENDLEDLSDNAFIAPHAECVMDLDLLGKMIQKYALRIALALTTFCKNIVRIIIQIV